MSDARPQGSANLTVVSLVAGMWMLIVDSTSKIGEAALSLSGVLTIGSCVLIVIAWFSVFVGRMTIGKGDRNISPGRHRIPAFLWLFLLLVLILTAARPDISSLQNASVYIIFILALAYGAESASIERAENVANLVRITGVLAAIFYVGCTLGGVEIYGIRSVSLSALISIAVVIPHRGRTSINVAFTAILLTAIVVSVSRTALLVSMCMLVFLVVRTGRRFRPLKVLLIGALAAAFVYVMFFTYEPIRDRFLGGDRAASFNGVKLNTSGRATLWEITWDDSLQSPWFGHGPGTASELISSFYPNIAHPHNDYLRLVHDFGFVGAALFVVGVIVVLVKLVASAIREDTPILWTGTMLLASVLIVMITDNVVVYAFVMFPAGYIIGLALGCRQGVRAGHSIDATSAIA